MKRQFAVGLAVLAGGALVAPVAAAKAERLSFYEVAGPMHFYDAAGKPINLNPPATLPKAGDSFDVADKDYVGSFRHHARRWTATDHLTCSFATSATGTCNFQLAIGGSRLRLRNVPVHFQDNTFVGRISGGTGIFKGAHGSVTITDLPNGNSDLVARVS